MGKGLSDPVGAHEVMTDAIDAKYFAHGQKPGSLELAFVGDSVYDLYVRSHLITTGKKVNALNRDAVAHVKAASQAVSLEKILPVLTEEEAAIVRRAQNTKQTPTKNASPEDYHKATALEAVLGYLYLTEQYERLNTLLSMASEL